MPLAPRVKLALKRARDAATGPIGSILSVRTSQPLIALTFDDGPDPDTTPRLLDVLAGRGARATFFVLLNRVERWPHLLRLTVDAGHEIALHGIDHRRLTRLPVGQAMGRMALGQRLLEERVGRAVRWQRPPYGAQGPLTWAAAKQAGMETVLWGPSLWDWKVIDEGSRTERALAGLTPGAIVLGHDGLAGPTDGAPATPKPALDRAAWAGSMLDRYSAAGLESVTLSELVAVGIPVKAARFVR